MYRNYTCKACERNCLKQRGVDCCNKHVTVCCKITLTTTEVVATEVYRFLPELCVQSCISTLLKYASSDNQTQCSSWRIHDSTAELSISTFYTSNEKFLNGNCIKNTGDKDRDGVVRQCRWRHS